MSAKENCETTQLNVPWDEGQEEEDEEEVTSITPPDGGWGWVVVFSSFMIHVIADGVTYTFGIFYMEFLKYFQESKGTTAWVASIMVGTTFCIGPIASGLTNKYGCQVVTIMGSVLAATGLLLSLLAPSVVYLFFTIGICTGAGFGLMYLPAIVCVTCYFEKKRAFATGIAVCGSGIGTFAMAPLTEVLVEKFGWKGAMLVIAGIVLNCCVFGALFRPMEPAGRTGNRKSKGATKSKPVSNGVVRKSSLQLVRNGSVEFPNRPSRAVSLPLHPKVDGPITEQGQALLKHNTIGHLLASPKHLEEAKQTALMTSSLTFTPENGLVANGKPHQHLNGVMYRKDVFYSGSIHNIPQCRASPAPKGAKSLASSRVTRFFACSREMRDAFLQMTDFNLLKNVIFLMFGLSNFFTNIGFNVPYLYSKDRAVGMGIKDEERASYLLSIIGIANTIGRVILGYLSDRKWVNRLWLYNASLTISGVTTAFSYFCDNYTLMAVYSAIFGATAGAYVSLTSVILVDLLGLDKLTNAFGLLLVFEGVACLVGPPITGWLYDWTGSYDPGFFLSGTMIAISGIMLFFIPCVERLLAKSDQTPASSSTNKDRLPSKATAFV